MSLREAEWELQRLSMCHGVVTLKCVRVLTESQLLNLIKTVLVVNRSRNRNM